MFSNCFFYRGALLIFFAVMLPSQSFAGPSSHLSSEALVVGSDLLKYDAAGNTNLFSVSASVTLKVGSMSLNTLPGSVYYRIRNQSGLNGSLIDFEELNENQLSALNYYLDYGEKALANFESIFVSSGDPGTPIQQKLDLKNKPVRSIGAQGTDSLFGDLTKAPNDPADLRILIKVLNYLADGTANDNATLLNSAAKDTYMIYSGLGTYSAVPTALKSNPLKRSETLLSQYTDYNQIVIDTVVTFNKHVTLGGGLVVSTDMNFNADVTIHGAPTFVSVTKPFNQLPQGTIIMFTGSNIPPGWLLCRGGASQESLYKVNSINVDVPDLSGKFIVGMKRGPSTNAVPVTDTASSGFLGVWDSNTLSAINPIGTFSRGPGSGHTHTGLSYALNVTTNIANGCQVFSSAGKNHGGLSVNTAHIQVSGLCGYTHPNEAFKKDPDSGIEHAHFDKHTHALTFQKAILGGHDGTEKRKDAIFLPYYVVAFLIRQY